MIFLTTIFTEWYRSKAKAMIKFRQNNPVKISISERRMDWAVIFCFKCSRSYGMDKDSLTGSLDKLAPKSWFH
ncbi:hypothetical protein HNP36_001286 [Chryseobacterium shigense]|uniref:Uncharacterized protein n=1 Tax=Chryseobacterium shigense TaxID=297244 RepID=A0A841N533_9FLAO|nr:hypothetical protein [Chryseobacterium shigense]